MRTLLAATLVLGLTSLALAGSDTPPEGPPWERNLLEAQTSRVDGTGGVEHRRTELLHRVVVLGQGHFTVLVR